MTESELAESIYWEAEQYIPFDIQDVNLDYQILDAGTGPDSRGSMEILLVAAKKEKIGDYTWRDHPGRQDAGHRRRRRLRSAERLRGELRVRREAGRGAAQRRRQRDQHQHSPGRSVAVRPRRLDGWQHLHRAVQKELDLSFRRRSS
jgi:hypothetical protein